MNNQDPYMGVPQQNNIPATPDDIYASMQQEDRAKNLIDQIAPDHQLMDLQWRIKGYIRDPVTRSWIKVNADAPEPHPILVARYISYLSTILNQNTTLSNYSGSEINQMMNLVITWIVDDLDSNAEEYGLQNDYSERTRIGYMILNTTFSAFKRAQNGMESRRIFKIMNVHEGLNPGQDNKQGGIMEALKFWK